MSNKKNLPTKIPDLDIDTKDREAFLHKLLENTKEGKIYLASMEKEGSICKHPTGIYFQKAPHFEENIIDGLKICTFPYYLMEELGWLKIDIINNHSYDLFESNSEIETYLNLEPKWELLQDKNIVKNLPHIGNYDRLLKKYKPKSIVELAAIISIIRPGKKHLIGKSMDYIIQHVWKKENNNSNHENKVGYSFKKSHAISYATLIVLILNKIWYG